MTRHEQLYVLNQEGREKLHKWLYPQDGAPRPVKGVSGVNYRTFAKIRDAKGARWCSWERFIKANPGIGIDESFLTPTLTRHRAYQSPNGRHSTYPASHEQMESGLPECLSTGIRLTRQPDNSSAPRFRSRILLAFALLASIVCVLLSYEGARSSLRADPDELIREIISLRRDGSNARRSITNDETDRIRAYDCVQLCELAWEHWFKPDEPIWDQYLTSVDDDIQAALKWLKDNDPPGMVQMAGALFHHWMLAGHYERNQHWLETVNDKSIQVEPGIKARCLAVLSDCYSEVHPARTDEGLVAARTALDLYRSVGNSWGQSLALRYEGMQYYLKGKPHAALNCYQQALDVLSATGGSAADLAHTYWRMSMVTRLGIGLPNEASTRLERALTAWDYAQKSGNPWLMQQSSTMAAGLLTQMLPKTRTVLKRSVAACRGWILWHQKQGDHVHERHAYSALAEAALQLPDGPAMVESLYGLLTVEQPANYQGPRPLEYQGKLLGAYLHWRNIYPDSAENLRAALDSHHIREADQSTWNEFVRQGRQMSLADAVRFALRPEMPPTPPYTDGI